MNALEFVVAALAAYRTGQIVAQEVVFAPLRGWIVQGRTPEELSGWRRWFGLMIHCAGCVSVWAGWFAVVALLLTGEGAAAMAIRVIVYGLAASGAAVVIGDYLYRRPR